MEVWGAGELQTITRQNDEAYMDCFCSNWLNWGGLDKRKIC